MSFEKFKDEIEDKIFNYALLTSFIIFELLFIGLFLTKEATYTGAEAFANLLVLMVLGVMSTFAFGLLMFAPLCGCIASFILDVLHDLIQEILKNKKVNK